MRFWQKLRRAWDFRKILLACIRNLARGWERRQRLCCVCLDMRDLRASKIRLLLNVGSTCLRMRFGLSAYIYNSAHRDLGLLSLVIGDTPGLEVHDRHLNFSFPIEKTYESPAQTILIGRQLERLTNGRYKAGGHLVRSYPNPKPKATDVPNSADSRQYRYSIVFVLRAHYPVPINTDNLTTSITGQFEHPMRDITAGDLFKEIHAAHYNINTAVEERNEQKRKLDEEKKQRSDQSLASS